MKMCVLPWVNLFVSESGGFYPCCLSRNSNAQFLDDSGTAIKIQNLKDLSQSWNSNTPKKLRKDMIDGVEPEICSVCFLDEKHGARSMRVKMNDLHLAQSENHCLGEETDRSAIKMLDLRFGNICNLACRMCHPEFSQKITKEFNEIHGRESNIDSGMSANQYWFKNSNSLRMLSNLESVENINFAGGEPLIIPEAIEFLEQIIEAGRSKKIRLSYNTNLTKLPSKLKEIWREFHSVHVFVSLEGWGNLNDYIRFPSKFGEIENNLRELDFSYEDYNLGYLGVHSTLQIYNAFGFVDLASWLKRDFKRVHIYPDVTFVTSPSYFDLRVMPPELKALAKNRLQSSTPLKVENPKDQYFNSSILAAIEFMNSSDLSFRWNEFVRVTKFFDNKRGQDISVAVPELAPFFHG